MRRIILARHGQTAWNKEEVFRGTADIPLNDFGREQARALGKRIFSLQLQDPLIISSPLGRARETAEISNQGVAGRQVLVDQGFTDINFGDWQGRSKAEIQQMQPELYRQWQVDPSSVVFPGGETLVKTANRAEEALNQLVRNHPEQDLVIVSHRVANKAVLCFLLGAGLQAFWKIEQDTACVNILEYDGRTFVVRTLNDTCHLLPLAQGDAADF